MHILIRQLRNISGNGLSVSRKPETAYRCCGVLRRAFILGVLINLVTATLFAKQGAGRALYTVPNTTFVEQPTGETVVTVNDTSGSISSLQTAINNARSANPNSVIVIHLLRGAIYTVSSQGLVLGSHECLVAEGAIIQAANSSVSVPLITIASGSTNVSVAGGTLDGQGASIQGILAPSAARVNIDKVVLRNFASDAISLTGNGNSTFDNEMTVTRSDVSGSSVGIHIQNSTQTTLLDNDCHSNGTGILVSAAWANIANNTCHNNTTGIDIAGGSDNVVANNTCNNNGTGIHAGATGGMIVSNALGGNTTAGISSDGTSNNFIDNLFTAGNATNFSSAGTSNNIIAYKAPISASGQNYFYPPLIDDQHTNPTIVNGMGRTDLTIGSTTIDDVQNQYNAARSANPNNVIVLHLNGTFTVGGTPLTLSSNTSVLLTGTIQINSSTTASTAVTASGSGQTRISLSGGVIDGGGLTGHNGISISSASMLQVDSMTLQNFGPANPRVGGSDVIHFSGGSTPYVVTRNFINGGAARGIWLQLSGQKSLITDNEVTNVNMDGVDCDSSTFGAVVKFNYCHDLVRYGVFIEQSAKNNLALGNVCNNDGRDINLFNNSSTPRAPVQFNSVVSNSLMGNNGIRNGGGSDPSVVTSHNFLFNNTIINASIQSQQNGSENYYSQNYQSGGTLSTAGAESFFNSADVSGNLQIHDANSGLAVIVQNASTTNGAAVVTAQPSPLGNGTNDDEWQFIPTSNGYYRVMNTNSGLAMAVQNASTMAGAPIVQFTFSNGAGNDEWLIQHADNGTYNVINRLSSLFLDVPGASTTPGTQLDQASANGAANQRFSLLEDAPASVDFALSATPASQTVTAGNSTSYTATVTPANGFNGTVNLSVTGLPSGATGTFNPASISGGSGSSTLSISTSSSTPAGTYTLTVTGTSGSLSHSATVTLVVTAPPDFAISATPSSQTVVQGGSTSYTASVSPLNGFNSTVNLSVSGLPSGATGTFNPASISGGSGSSTLSVSTSASTQTGTFTVTITGTSSSPSLTHSTTVTLVVNPSTGLPPGWTDSDIGTPGVAGSATFTSGTFTVNGGGADIWSTSDNFNYAYVSTTGDVTITARVASQQSTNAWAKSGVMIRESTAANSSFVHVFVTPANGVNMQYRPSTGASAVQLAQVAGVAAPYWVRIQRSGSTFTGFASADGVSWTQVGTINVTMASNALQGLSVTAHNNTALNTSTFDNVTVSTPAPDFSISATPSSQTVTQGGSTNYTASVSPINGFTGTVSLSVSGLPSGATGTFNPTSISGGSGSSTLTIATASSTPAGTFTLTITGASGSLSHATTVTLVVNPSSGLPPGWTDSDIGTPGLAGSATFNSGTFTVNGSGGDIWSTSDNFNYAYVSTTGDVTITARVASQQNTNAWAKSGVMIRETTAANAAFVHVFVTPANGVNMQYRPSTGASAVQLAQVAGVAAPYWVRIQRSGSTFTGFASADGVSWTQVGTISVTMASSALQGLSVTAHDNTMLNTSTFDNVSVTMPAPPITLAPTADAYVRDGTSANTNFGTATTLVVKTSTAGFNRNTFVKFDLSTVSTVSAAKLRLFGSYGATSGTSPVTAHQVADNSWTETGITWNNQPAVGAAMTTVSVGLTGQYWEWDVTSYIQSAKAAGQTSVTLELQNDVSTPQTATFNSREAGSNTPQLVVTP